MSGETKPVDLVLEGGGMKAIGLAGAYAVLSEHGFAPANVAGASAGAIVAALIAAGYGPDELRREILGLDFRQFRDEGWEDKLPLIDRSASLLLDLGIYEGDRLEEWIRERLERKDVRTFSDLPGPSLHVIVSDVTDRALLVFPRDAARIGLEPGTLDVARVLRMSAGIPVFFEPVRHEDPRTGREHLLVDGGMLSNFPVWLFDAGDAVPERPTFGLLLVEPEPRRDLGRRLEPRPPGRGITALVDYLRALAETMMAAHDRLYVEQADFARTIPIPTLGVGTTEFDLPPERAEALYESGRRAAEAFLATWDFDAYRAEFAAGRGHSRRQAVADVLSG